MTAIERDQTPNDLFSQLSQLGGEGKRGAYKLAQVADVLGIPRRRLRAWFKAGLIEPASEVRGVPYFDFHQVASAKTLCDLSDAGVTTTQMRWGLERLREWMGDSAPLDQVVMLERNGRLLVRLESGLVEPSGQMHFEFGEEFSVVSAEPVSAEEWFHLGCEHEEEGSLQDAIHAYRQALAVGGPDADICFNLANVLYADGQRTAAVERYRVAVELAPDFAEAWNNLGVALGETRQFDEAKHALATAITLGFADARFNLARLSQRARGTA